MRNQLQAKAKQDPNPNSKYGQAFQQLQGASDADDVVTILTNARLLTTRDGRIKGGKKTKKNRKQKGGYTYKVNSKRRSISTTSSSRSSASGRGLGRSKRR